MTATYGIAGVGPPSATKPILSRRHSPHFGSRDVALTLSKTKMPYFNLRTVKGLLNEEQKRYLMEKFTDLLVEVEGCGDPDFRQMVWIRIDEQEPENWQIGTMRPNKEQIVGFVQLREAKRTK